jgi:adenylate cyclase
VRLACQIRPNADITVTRILRASTAGPQDADLQETDAAGVEKTLAVLFLDMRNFTQMSQTRLPYDTVYILNEFFGAVGDAIVSHGGWIDKFLGDGLLAIFGRDQGIEVGCRQALRAARAIDLALDHVNAKLQAEIGQPLRVGMGLHAGPILLGRIGFGEDFDLTVIGTAVNVASRLESLAKETGCQIMMSRAVADNAGWSDPDGIVTSVEVRGVTGQIVVVGIKRGRDLPNSILSSTVGEEPAANRNSIRAQ